MFRPVLILLALIALAGCAVPARNDRMVDTVTMCRRAADLGPSGMAQLIADPAAAQTARSATPPPSIWANLYRNCLRARGIAVPSGRERPVVLDRVGEGPRIPRRKA